MVGPSSQISKILLAFLLFLLVFYIFMDIELYLRIQNYPIERNFHFNITEYKATIAATEILPAEAVTIQSYERHTRFSCDINPLCHITVKAVLLDHTNHYVFATFVTIFDNAIGLSRSTFVTANMISYTHVVVAALSAKLISLDSLSYRRLGVVFFQLRTFLDDLDGHVARAKKNIRGERSEVGTSGYYIDGICDGIGCIFLVLGIFFYLKNNPPRRGYSQLPLKETKLPETIIRPKIKSNTRKISEKVISFTGQLLLSSTAWNRYIAVYQNMLENNNVSPTQFARQNLIFKSSWFFSVAWMWRIVNVHSLLHCLLLSIFCDKVWEFLKAIQYIGFVILVVVICVTEVHLLKTKKFIYDLIPDNNYTL